jgi:hypothetical protein
LRIKEQETRLTLQEHAAAAADDDDDEMYIRKDGGYIAGKTEITSQVIEYQGCFYTKCKRIFMNEFYTKHKRKVWNVH